MECLLANSSNEQCWQIRNTLAFLHPADFDNHMEDIIASATPEQLNLLQQCVGFINQPNAGWAPAVGKLFLHL